MEITEKLFEIIYIIRKIVFSTIVLNKIKFIEKFT